MMPIFEIVRAILPTDLVWKFERDPLSSSHVIVHTNTKTDAAKINTFRKTKFSGGMNHMSTEYNIAVTNETQG